MNAYRLQNYTLTMYLLSSEISLNTKKLTKSINTLKQRERILSKTKRQKMLIRIVLETAFIADMVIATTKALREINVELLNEINYPYETN